MNTKTVMLALVFLLIIPNIILAQNTDKTIQELKKAENVARKGKALVSVFKKKKKSENKEDESNEKETNNVTDSPTETHVEDQNLKVSNEDLNEISLTKEAAILFKNIISKTSNAEKNEITSYMNIKATPDAEYFYINDVYYKDYPFSILVYPLDLNHDGIEEIALVYGHAAISGDNVISTLFIKDNLGHYNANFGYSGSLIILPNSSKDFPNIALGGPGFEFPIWHWNGKNYINRHYYR
ncbi:hypothetical protein ACS386_07620 [Flavobacteriaceae bacterium LMO-SS05]